jgi:hypothetical protein
LPGAPGSRRGRRHLGLRESSKWCNLVVVTEGSTIPGSRSSAQQGVHAPPPAAATLEALRGLGYTLPTATADLIDNCLSAGAENVWLVFHWAGRDSYISILDDGHGMISEEIVTALTLGSLNPTLPRASGDLGRFGLGLKTASLSQGRRLTVGSRRRKGEVSAFRWDLDHIARVDDWQLLPGADEDSRVRLSPLDDLASGTLVLLENLDRVIPPAEVSNRRAQDDFLALVDRVEEHLGMVFHRYLEGVQPHVRIFINGGEGRHRVRPWDPFLARHPATIATPVERIQSPAGMIEVQGFVLPHRDRLGDTAFEAAAGPEGWTAQQGFYVYRGRRLLLPGSWLGLGAGRAWTKEEPFKLARLRLDIPNSADAAWKIDVRKSNAEPPEFLKGRLRDLAEYVRNQARRVFAFRGSRESCGATRQG